MDVLDTFIRFIALVVYRGYYVFIAVFYMISLGVVEDPDDSIETQIFNGLHWSSPFTLIMFYSYAKILNTMYGVGLIDIINEYLDYFRNI